MPSHGVLVKIDCMDTGPIIDQLRNDFPGLLAIYGFGSRFSGQASPQSDLDLAILVEGKATAEALWAEANRLADMLGMDVDLVDLRSASTVMQYQIVTTGQRLWQRDAQADIYESYILSAKTDLDALRSGQIEDIQHSGRIYDR
jgi:predicted nucleotidyltransferase